MAAPTATASAACAPGGAAVAESEGLSFLEKVSARLEIELSEAPVPAAPNLMNQKAPRSAKLEKVALPSQIYENGTFRKMTAAEAEMVVFRGAELTLRGLGKAVKHTAPNCKHFTVRDVLKAVEETERQTRAESEWDEGIDVHHVYFEGLTAGEGDVWHIGWGS
jgi:hypothetical protein